MTNIALSLPAAPWVLWVGGLAVVVFLLCLPRLLGIVYIPHTQVGIIEKIWSSKGSLREGQIIARNGEAGYQAKFLRGGIHFGLYPWQYRIHKEPLVSVAEGKWLTFMRGTVFRSSRSKRSAERWIPIISRTPSVSSKPRVREDGSAEFCAKASMPLTWRCS